jgi:pimeloyl-ACP methyl ester carboxylesterase
MNESCCQFGELRHLAGVLTEPSASPRNVAVVLVSAGLAPKYGPFRLYAELARQLSTEAFLTLRFDLGGIGDSRQAHTNSLLGDRTQRDIAAAVDYLASHFPLHSIVLGGLCSGAEDAFRAAELDSRVTGVVMIDPFAYRTSGWRWRHLLYRARRRLLRAVGVYRPLAPPTPAKESTSAITYKYMDRAESRRILKTLVERRVRVHFVYTGGSREVFNHEHQLKAMFRDVDFEGLVTLTYLPHLDHTQLLFQDRALVVRTVVRALQDWRRACRPVTPREARG